jgi:hypothetical protein
VRVFLAERGEGVNYAKGVWHHALFALFLESEFIVVDRGGPGGNCEEIALRQPILITEQGLQEKRVGVGTFRRSGGAGRVCALWLLNLTIL